MPQPEDLDEYIAECDEHLSTARRIVLDLEAVQGLEHVPRDSLDELFRAFHSIKGLSGMVGARAAEEVGHQLETYLGAIRKGSASITQAGADVLLEGVTLIEAAITAFRGGTAAPDTAPLAGRVMALLPSRPGIHATPSTEQEVRWPAAVTLPGDRQAKLAAAQVRGEQVWRVTFTPDQALASRGVNVNTVRSRLQAVGEIVHAEPAPGPGGGIQFAFFLIAPAGADFNELAADGIVFEPYRQSPPSTEPSATPRPGSGLAPGHLVRVDLGRLDELMRTVGDLVISRARLEHNVARVARHLPPRELQELEETAQVIERQLRVLREGVMRVRMVPIRDLFARMRLVVRDLTRETGKEVELSIAGEDTEIDKFVVERIADPLLHLVRNAVSHGIEPAVERVAAGKSPKGRLALRAATAGGTIVLEVEDDGRGVQVETVFARARETGLVPTDAAADPAAVLDLICTPGLSTRDMADRASGRGVGMDVVRRAVEGLGGALALDFRRSSGTRFTARLPLTLVVADVLTVTVGGLTYAIPQSAVREVLPMQSGSTTLLENNEFVRYHGGVLPLVHLGDLLQAPRPSGTFVALVVGEEPAAVALAADRALGLREVVVRSLADALVQVPGIGGATELGDGRPILILDPAGLARQARRRNVTPPPRPRG